MQRPQDDLDLCTALKASVCGVKHNLALLANTNINFNAVTRFGVFMEFYSVFK